MHRLVVSTGGGAVVRPINWYLSQITLMKFLYLLDPVPWLSDDICLFGWYYCSSQETYAQGY